MEYSDLTIELGNYGGYREKIQGKGRIETTINSLLKCCPFVKECNFLLIDNDSEDGSDKFLFLLPFGTKKQLPRIAKWDEPEPASKNITAVLKWTVENTKTKYLWRIENDSYFYNSNPFVEKAIEVLENNPDIHIIHLRRWTPMDIKDSVGIGQSLNRISEIRTAPSGFKFYIIEKREEKNIWIPLGKEFSKNFQPDKEKGYGKCPLGEEVGCIRMRSDGQYERLLPEKWATYSNHGFIAKTESFKFIFEKYNPKTEKELADCFKKHFRAAKLDEDAFIQFGWNVRIKKFTDKEALETFEWAKKNNHASCIDFGLFSLDNKEYKTFKEL